MKTGIYRKNPLGQDVEVEQKQIDYWCGLCQFPTKGKRCQGKKDVQACWNKIGSIAGVWHILHECPFVHIGKKCKCNDFKAIGRAFEACGLKYRKEIQR